ncbi:uncharacterized protein LOC119730174 [Patiria miniata]|uniref:Uncharacterized protein n=1 Tax=Patiria miniata TaxID=46514 RepID=A0A914A508_PATMI|nr:uncharacterized protein LOC119730174 [Patiria miniata]
MADHAEQLNKLERFSRRNNLPVIGFPQQKVEDCLALAHNLFKEKFKMPDAKLERAHRDRPKMDGRPQHLLIKLNCYQDKIKILQQQRQVRTSRRPDQSRPAREEKMVNTSLRSGQGGNEVQVRSR